MPGGFGDYDMGMGMGCPGGNCGDLGGGFYGGQNTQCGGPGGPPCGEGSSGMGNFGGYVQGMGNGFGGDGTYGSNGGLGGGGHFDNNGQRIQCGRPNGPPCGEGRGNFGGFGGNLGGYGGRNEVRCGGPGRPPCGGAGGYGGSGGGGAGGMHGGVGAFGDGQRCGGSGQPRCESRNRPGGFGGDSGQPCGGPGQPSCDGPGFGGPGGFVSGQNGRCGGPGQPQCGGWRSGGQGGFGGRSFGRNQFGGNNVEGFGGREMSEGRGGCETGRCGSSRKEGDQSGRNPPYLSIPPIPLPSAASGPILSPNQKNILPTIHNYGASEREQKIGLMPPDFESNAGRHNQGDRRNGAQGGGDSGGGGCGGDSDRPGDHSGKNPPVLLASPVPLPTPLAGTVPPPIGEPPVREVVKLPENAPSLPPRQPEPPLSSSISTEEDVPLRPSTAREETLLSLPSEEYTSPIPEAQADVQSEESSEQLEPVASEGRGSDAARVSPLNERLPLPPEVQKDLGPPGEDLEISKSAPGQLSDHAAGLALSEHGSEPIEGDTAINNHSPDFTKQGYHGKTGNDGTRKGEEGCGGSGEGDQSGKNPQLLLSDPLPLPSIRSRPVLTDSALQAAKQSRPSPCKSGHQIESVPSCCCKETAPQGQKCICPNKKKYLGFSSLGQKGCFGTLKKPQCKNELTKDSLPLPSSGTVFGPGPVDTSSGLQDNAPAYGLERQTPLPAIGQDEGPLDSPDAVDPFLPRTGEFTNAPADPSLGEAFSPDYLNNLVQPGYNRQFVRNAQQPDSEKHPQKTAGYGRRARRKKVKKVRRAQLRARARTRRDQRGALLSDLSEENIIH
ncbi:hypothetical protein AB6A40_000330 [Gnathostoma spinigerum]|uniref:Uncharacterized protein n=1 Tax=Gnathostoma spinigerum TaxID=75299 RepID=A0ABD6E3X0_9BILA